MRLSPTKTNLHRAANIKAKIEEEIATGTFDYAKYFPNSSRVALFSKGPKPSNQRVGEALEDFLADKRRGCAVSTWKDYRSAIQNYLIPEFGALRLRDLTTAHIRQWLGGLTISNKRINNVLVPLRGMLKDAYVDGLIDRDPMDRIRNLPITREDPDPFAPDEQESILAALAGTAQARNLIQFAFWTGLRTSELLAVEWGDVDWKRGVVRIRRANVRGDVKTPKTRAGMRDVKLLAPAKEALKAQKAHSFLAGGAIFLNPRSSKPWRDDTHIRQQVWEPALKRSGVRYRNLYQTRHTYASMMLSTGENPMWVAQQMGHADWGMIRKIYGRWIADMNPDAGAKAEAWLRGYKSQSSIKGESA
ncbi:putative phage integrase [Magnetofaba australis IT-1]|uniref:Putative phage integrase n=1 Tax=Magnetofaba australis IT-1 TaxID=1434232 RepID=A0A1Y2KAD4_9PROT|nr:putative phage integrase [Magnetofaba australis IT-1]